MAKAIYEEYSLKKSILNNDLKMILEARHYDPARYLGLHQIDAKQVFRTFHPHVDEVQILSGDTWIPVPRKHESGLFELSGTPTLNVPVTLRLIKNRAHENAQSTEGETQVTHDPYSLPLSITAENLYLFGEGSLKQAYKMLGAHPDKVLGVDGIRFSVWAPNAERVSVVGDFNRWDGRVHPMRNHGSSGVWELFLPGLQSGSLYKFEIRNRASGHVLIKSDPFAFACEKRPGTASVALSTSNYQWQDAAWIEKRKQASWMHAPMNCYELHPGAWRRKEDGQFLSFRELATILIPYLTQMAYTHVELLPISEHPLNESWGYQTTGYYAVTHRYGSADDFRFFVDACHQANIGVILDWVPGHFPKDDWALAHFDGTALFEHEDPRLGEHQDWGTLIFNYGRNEVRNFLIANAHYWLSEFHIDGLRVDAVASMLYLDYSRKAGEWLPNAYGGRENLDAIHFLRQLNIMVHEDFPGAVTIAEESTAWPMVSRPVYLGGLGFSMKWNMGWMHDTLSYMAEDPIHRRYHHDRLTFSQLYAYSENFVLPLSHDEVVHGKKSLLDKMPGDTWQKFANLRLLLGLQVTMPGKKLGFMGNEFAQGREWNVNASLDWHVLENSWHQGIQRLCKDMNHLYLQNQALHDLDFEQSGFGWVDCNDVDHSIISFVRKDRNGHFVLVIFNFTPVPRAGYRIGVSQTGVYLERLNSDALCYGGSNMGNAGKLHTEATPWMGQTQSLLLNLPPLAMLVLEPEPS